MDEKDATKSKRRGRSNRGRSILATVVIIGLLIGSWMVISRMASRRLPTSEGRITIAPVAPQDMYVGYKDTVYRLSARNGSVVWQHTLKQPYKPDRRIGSSLNVYVVGDTVYAVVEYAVYALQGSSGKELWHYYPTPSPAEVAQNRGQIIDIFPDKKEVYVYYDGGSLLALDAQNGTQKWGGLKFPNGASISASDGTLYIDEFQAEKELQVLRAFDGASGHERWRFERQLWGGSSVSYPSVINGVVYTSGNPLYALDAQSGKKLWEQRLANQSLYFGEVSEFNGVLYADTGAALDQVGGQEIPPDIYHVYAFDARTGRQLWMSDAGYVQVDEPVSAGVVLVRTPLEKGGRQTLRALDAKNGTVRWQIALVDQSCQAGDICFSPPPVHVANGKLYVLDDKQPRAIQVFDVVSGKQIGQHGVSIPGKVGIGPSLLSNGLMYVRSAVHEGGAYVSGSSNTFWHYVIYAIRLVDGTTAWHYEVGSLLEYQEPISELLLAP